MYKRQLLASFTPSVASAQNVAMADALFKKGLADMQVLAAIEASHRELKPQAISCSQRFQTLGLDMLRSFPPSRDKLLLT